MDERLKQASCIVFDVGNVLLTFEPEKVMGLIPQAHRDTLRQAIFGKDFRWAAFDLGVETNEDIARSMAEAANVPGGTEMVLHALYHFPETMRPLPLYRLIPELKKSGKQLYGLTNYCEPSFTYTQERFTNLKLLDGVVVSNREKIAKPDPAIFALLTERFGVNPREALFIDDSLPNVLTAAAIGFKTWNYAGEDTLPEADGA
ncbi:MAG: HAD family phosphatase [Clostridia bacterium]|nr:HAD family phosphatase [Clostridia bacterium]